MGGAAVSKNLGVSDIQVLKENEPANPAKCLVVTKNGSPTAGYQIGYKIGEGAFAMVRVSTHNKLKKKFAIKEVYTKDLSNDQLSDLDKEICILSQMRHSNICGIHEVYKTPNHTYLILEYLSGGELFDAICQQECYSEDDARGVMMRIAYAVLYCHRHGVMHRDLKPENLILVSNETNTDIKLIDFGYITPFGPDIPKETRLCGTPGYISPEMMLGIPYGPEVDIWSLAVIMYVLLAGTSPFPAEDKETLVTLVTSGAYSYPEKYWGSISPAAKDLIDKMLVVDQESRISIEGVLQHPWLTGCDVTGPEKAEDLTNNLQHLREWNDHRKKAKKLKLVMKSCVNFTLAGKRYKAGVLSAAKHAKELQKKGIDWHNISAEEICQQERSTENTSA